jgi:hypothetical protein
MCAAAGADHDQQHPQVINRLDPARTGPVDALQKFFNTGGVSGAEAFFLFETVTRKSSERSADAADAGMLHSGPKVLIQAFTAVKFGSFSALVTYMKIIGSGLAGLAFVSKHTCSHDDPSFRLCGVNSAASLG